MRPRVPTTIAATPAAALLLAVLITATLTLSGPAHAAPFSYSAADAATAITIDSAPAAVGDSICALDNLTPAGSSITTAGAACAAIAADGSWSLEIDTDNFDGDAFLVLQDGSASSLPISLANGSVSFDSLSDLALHAAAVDADASLTLLLTLSPRETEETGTVQLSAYVFGLTGPLTAQQVTFSFSGPGSPSNAIPVPTDADGLAPITVFAGALGSVDATATLTPSATLTLSYDVVDAPMPDPLPAVRLGFNAWLGRDATASEVVQNGQILWKWDRDDWIAFVRTNSGLELGSDYDLTLGDVLFLAQQS